MYGCEFDIVSIGYEDKNRQYPVLTGFENWKKQLKKQFPDDENAIDKYFQLVKLNIALIKINYSDNLISA